MTRIERAIAIRLLELHDELERRELLADEATKQRIMLLKRQIRAVASRLMARWEIVPQRPENA